MELNSQIINDNVAPASLLAKALAGFGDGPVVGRNPFFPGSPGAL